MQGITYRSSGVNFRHGNSLMNLEEDWTLLAFLLSRLLGKLNYEISMPIKKIDRCDSDYINCCCICRIFQVFFTFFTSLHIKLDTV